jgi:2-dehydro-3-deoxygluconokinase
MDLTFFQGSRLCVVGSVCRDVKTSTLASGERLLQDGETPADSIVETIGGGGAISALAAAALGAESRFAGKIGADALGDRLEGALSRRGVRCFMHRDPKVRTGSSVVLSHSSGARHFISCQPNNRSLAFCDLNLAMLDGASHLLRADVWFSEPMLEAGNTQLLKAARQRGLATSLDVNWDPLWGLADAGRIVARKEAVRRLLPHVNLAHGNVRELNLFADSTDLQTTLRRLADWGAEAVVIHMGSQGAGYYAHGELTVEPCAPVQQQPVHSAGTGDLLSVCMMLLYQRRDMSIAVKLRLANRVVAEFMEGKLDLLPELTD